MFYVISRKKIRLAASAYRVRARHAYIGHCYRKRNVYRAVIASAWLWLYTHPL